VRNLRILVKKMELIQFYFRQPQRRSQQQLYQRQVRKIFLIFIIKQGDLNSD
jgi:hypothetical protein